MSNGPEGVDRLAAVRARFLVRLGEERAALASGALSGEDTIMLVHRMAGLAGTLGADEVCSKAQAYERGLLDADGDAGARARSHADLIAAIDGYLKA